MKLLICTIKEWNIVNANLIKRDYKDEHEVFIFDEKEQLTVKNVEKIAPDYIFFPHWSYIIPDVIFEKYQCIVFHMTDLPYGRGGSPLQNLIVRGFKETKISAIRVERELDAGPIYMKEKLKLDGTAEEILKRASDIIFQKMIPEIISTKPTPKKQEGEVVVFKRRKPQDGEIEPEMSKETIYDYIRMLDAKGYPDAFIRFGKYKLNLSKATYKNEKLIATIEFMEEKEDE